MVESSGDSGNDDENERIIHWLSNRVIDPEEEVTELALPPIMPALLIIESTDVDRDVEDDENYNKIAAKEREGKTRTALLRHWKGQNFSALLLTAVAEESLTSKFA
jgi:hypothetical protein